jgi:RND family efflux transporter MFP subunit
MGRKTWWWLAGALLVTIVVAVTVVRGRGREAVQPPQDRDGQASQPRDAQTRQGPATQGQEAQAQQGANPQAPRSPGQRRGGGSAPMVAVGRLRTMDIPAVLSLTASIVAEREARVFSRVAGYLESVLVRPGDNVRTGQVVAVVEHSQLDAQVLQAEQAALAARSGVATAQASLVAASAQIVNAQAARRKADADLQSARAALDRAKAQLGVAQAAHTRISTLFRDGLIAQSAVDSARGDLQSAQAGVDAAEAQIRVVQAQIEQAEAQIRVAQAQENAAASQVRTQQAQAASLDASLQNARLAQASATIRAPWAGIVVSRSLDSGALVSAGGSTPIVSIADLDVVAVVVNVAEASMSTLRRGSTAVIGVDAFPGRVFKGRVGRIAGGVDTDTRTVQVEIDVENKDHALLPGMYARVKLSGPPREARVVPLSALVTVSGQQYVWVVVDGKVARRAVKIGATTASVVEIVSGVEPDETIVFRGTEMVREGGAVRTPAARSAPSTGE